MFFSVKLKAAVSTTAVQYQGAQYSSMLYTIALLRPGCHCGGGYSSPEFMLIRFFKLNRFTYRFPNVISMHFQPGGSSLRKVFFIVKWTPCSM